MEAVNNSNSDHDAEQIADQNQNSLNNLETFTSPSLDIVQVGMVENLNQDIIESPSKSKKEVSILPHIHILIDPKFTNIVEALSELLDNSIQVIF